MNLQPHQLTTSPPYNLTNSAIQRLKALVYLEEFFNSAQATQ